jgi:hypothetical protein
MELLQGLLRRITLSPNNGTLVQMPRNKHGTLVQTQRNKYTGTLFQTQWHPSQNTKKQTKMTEMERQKHIPTDTEAITVPILISNSETAEPLTVFPKDIPNPRASWVFLIQTPRQRQPNTNSKKRINGHTLSPNNGTLVLFKFHGTSTGVTPSHHSVAKQWHPHPVQVPWNFYRGVCSVCHVDAGTIFPH